jgi:uncharacterized protein YraI
VIHEPTCTEAGYTVHTCPDCGHSETDTPVEALGHDFGPWGQGAAAGTEQRECSRCHELETRYISRMGTVTGDYLRIRAGAGTQYEQVGTLKKGDRVVILETAKVGDATWARIEKGWIHMYYVQMEETEVPGGTITRTVTTELRIRAGAGTNYEKVGTYQKGDVVMIYEQTTVKGRPWGRTDRGWICLEYVK